MNDNNRPSNGLAGAGSRSPMFRLYTAHLAVLLAAGFASIPSLRADEVTDWNLTTENAVKTAALNPGIQGRFLAIVQTSVYDAVNGIVGK
jgi:hypothetical protein